MEVADVRVGDPHRGRRAGRVQRRRRRPRELRYPANYVAGTPPGQFLRSTGYPSTAENYELSDSNTLKRANVGELVLGCIEAKSCIFQHLLLQEVAAQLAVQSLAKRCVRCSKKKKISENLIGKSAISVDFQQNFENICKNH